MRRMLDPKTIGGGGGLPSSVEFDKEGNRKLTKNLEVDGKLKLKSLVSASNPDGDITKELGGGGGTTNTLYQHSIHLYDTDKSIWLVLYSYVSDAFNLPKVRSRLTHYMQCSGCIKIGSTYYNATSISYQSNKFNIEYSIPASGYASISVNTLDMSDHPSAVE